MLQRSSQHLRVQDFMLMDLCFTGLLMHKDKTGKIPSMNKYRPIALASALSMVLLLHRLQLFLITTDNHLGLKASTAKIFASTHVKKLLAYSTQT